MPGPTGPGRRASFTNPDRDGLRLLLGAPRTIPSLQRPALEADAPRASEPDPPCAAACLRSAAGSPPAPDAPLPLRLGVRLRLTFPPPERAVSRFRLPGRTRPQSGSAVLNGSRLPEGQRVKVAVATRVIPLLLSGPRPSIRPRPEVVVGSPPPFTATSWRVAQEVATNLPAG